eukprot:scaffold1440_cov332-Pavlova_lutheri.AAC.66
MGGFETQGKRIEGPVKFDQSENMCNPKRPVTMRLAIEAQVPAPSLPYALLGPLTGPRAKSIG